MGEFLYYEEIDSSENIKLPKDDFGIYYQTLF